MSRDPQKVASLFLLGVLALAFLLAWIGERR